MFNDVGNNQVIIVGGGLSGLAAATTLKNNNIDAIILEGKDRLGGRTHTVNITDDVLSEVELGAYWLDEYEKNYVYNEYIKDSDIELVSPPAQTFRFYNAEKSRWLRYYELLLPFATTILALVPTLFCKDDSPGSLADRLWFVSEDNVDDESTLNSLLHLYEVLQGAGLEEINGNSICGCGYFDYEWYDSLAEVAGFVKGDFVQGGFVKLVEKLAGELNDEQILLNKTVSRITQDGDSNLISVETLNGTIYEANYVIVTAPLGVLKSDMITFDPELSEDKKGAIQRIGYGVVERMAMSFENAFWRRSEGPESLVYLPSKRFTNFIDITATAGSPTIILIFSGDSAQELAAGEKESLIEEVKLLLEQVFPDTYEEPIGVVTSNWLNETHFRGAYSYPSVDQLPDDRGLLAAPDYDGHLLFAGEATHEIASYVEGAVKSGVREAERVIADLNI